MLLFKASQVSFHHIFFSPFLISFLLCRPDFSIHSTTLLPLYIICDWTLKRSSSSILYIFFISFLLYFVRRKRVLSEKEFSANNKTKNIFLKNKKKEMLLWNLLTHIRLRASECEIKNPNKTSVDLAWDTLFCAFHF